MMLDLALAPPVAAQPGGKPGVRTHQLLIAILGAAQAKQSRLAVLQEILAAVRRRDDYENSAEELTPLHGDPLAALPLLAAVAATLAWPPAAKLFERGAVGAYALTPAGWAKIVEAASGKPNASIRERSDPHRCLANPTRPTQAAFSGTTA